MTEFYVFVKSFYFLQNCSTFDHIFNLRPNFTFLTKFSIFYKILPLLTIFSICNIILHFWQNFPCFTKLFRFWPYFQSDFPFFLPNWHIFGKIFDFHEFFRFWFENFGFFVNSERIFTIYQMFTHKDGSVATGKILEIMVKNLENSLSKNNPAFPRQFWLWLLIRVLVSKPWVVSSFRVFFYLKFQHRNNSVIGKDGLKLRYKKNIVYKIEI